jgi:ATP-dependent protease HslVU (ClpYQ) peptidase subunit
MTCIVGVKQDGKVYIGGDSLGSNSSLQKTVRADEKVFVKGDMIFGFTSSYRMGQILRYSFSAPPRYENIDDMTYLVAHFIPALITAYESGGFLTKRNNEHTGGVFLLGYRGELYKVDSDFQVGKPVLPYDACGCGEDYAKGALFTTNTDKYSAKDKIENALSAAEVHSAGVGKPFTIVEL